MAIVPPSWSGVAVAVTCPERTDRWWDAFTSVPTAVPACKPAAIEPTVSASTTDAPPWSRP